MNDTDEPESFIFKNTFLVLLTVSVVSEYVFGGPSIFQGTNPFLMLYVAWIGDEIRSVRMRMNPVSNDE